MPDDATPAPPQPPEPEATKDTTFILAFLLLFGYLSLAFYVAMNPVPPESKDMLNGVMQGLQNALMLILGYFYGAGKTQERTAERVAASLARRGPRRTDVEQQQTDVQK